jgi:DNA-binding MarR family transcriptional regulator
MIKIYACEAMRQGQPGRRGIKVHGETQDILAGTRQLYEAMYRFDAWAAAQLGLHVTDLRCINALEGGPLSAGEIGARLALTSGSVTALVNRLERGGYIARLSDPQDRRRAVVALTPRFRAEADRIYGRLGAAIAASFATVDAGKRAAAVDVIARLTDGFAKLPPTPPPAPSQSG